MNDFEVIRKEPYSIGIGKFPLQIRILATPVYKILAITPNSVKLLPSKQISTTVSVFVPEHRLQAIVITSAKYLKVFLKCSKRFSIRAFFFKYSDFSWRTINSNYIILPKIKTRHCFDYALLFYPLVKDRKIADRQPPHSWPE